MCVSVCVCVLWCCVKGWLATAALNIFPAVGRNNCYAGRQTVFWMAQFSVWLEESGQLRGFFGFSVVSASWCIDLMEGSLGSGMWLFCSRIWGDWVLFMQEHIITRPLHTVPFKSSFEIGRFSPPNSDLPNPKRLVLNSGDPIFHLFCDLPQFSQTPFDLNSWNCFCQCHS